MKLLCGAIRFDGKCLPSELLESMAAAMTEPEQVPHMRSWTSSHAALATLNFAPVSSRAAGLKVRYSGGVLVGDVRLDDPEAANSFLHCDLADHECIAEGLLDRFGLHALRMLAGDFAVANWNVRRRELTLARDGMGVRPLVYYHVPGRFIVFASFPRALHASGLLHRSLNQLALLREMMGVRRTEETLFEGVQSVKAGTSILFGTASHREQVHWRPRLQPLSFRSPEEGAEAMADAMHKAVKSRVRGSGPVATHLSGGLDSSAITVLAARQLQPQARPLLAYQFLDNVAHDPERPYVQAVLQQEPSVQWFPIPQTLCPVRTTLKRDLVLSESNLDPDNQACAQASARGATLMLSGWGGDEGATFNGRGALASALFSAQWRYLLREVRGMRAERGFSAAQVAQGEILRYLRQGIAGTLRPNSNIGPWFSLLRPSVRRQVMQSAGRGLHLGTRVRHNQLRLISGPHIEFRTTNWAEIGTRYGMAFAFPMLDRRVIDCALSMPGAWYVRGGWKRRPFRDAMKGILPEAVRLRHDKLTPFPQAVRWLATQSNDLESQIREMLSRPAFATIFQPNAVEHLLRDLPASPDWSPTHTGSTLIPLLCLLNYGEFLLREQSSSAGARAMSFVPAYARSQHG